MSKNTTKRSKEEDYYCCSILSVREDEGSETGSQLRWLERAPDKRKVGGSNPLEPTKKRIEKRRGGVAQLGEHLPCKQGVKGSNPFISTKKTLNAEKCLFEYKQMFFGNQVGNERNREYLENQIGEKQIEHTKKTGKDFRNKGLSMFSKGALQF